MNLTVKRIEKAMRASSNAKSEWAIAYWAKVASELRRSLN